MERKLKNMFYVIALLSLALAVFQVSACQTVPQTAAGFPTPEKSPTEDPVARAKENQMKQNQIDGTLLANNRRLWLEKNVAHYKMTVSAQEGGNVQFQKSVVIEVQNNQIISTSFNKKPSERDTEIYQRIGTIEKQFDVIQQVLDKGRMVWVKYNKEFGYPEEMTVMYYGNGTDGQVQVAISEFEVL